MLPQERSFEVRTTITTDRALRIGDEQVIDLKLASRTSYGTRALAGFGYRAASL